MASINRLAWTLNYSSLQLSSVSVCPSPTAPNPLNILSQITSLWSLSCISNCQCFRSLPLRLPDFRVAISLIPSRFNATPRNLGFKKSLLVMCFHRQAATLRIFRSRNLCALEKDLQSLKGPFGGWGVGRNNNNKKNSVWSLHFNEHPYWFRALCPVFAYLRQNAALEQNCCLSSLCGFWKTIFILTVHFYSTWKNMLAFHFHADHGTICPLSLDLLAGG